VISFCLLRAQVKGRDACIVYVDIKGLEAKARMSLNMRIR
jgi:hypothetical protein